MRLRSSPFFLAVGMIALLFKSELILAGNGNNTATLSLRQALNASFNQRRQESDITTQYNYQTSSWLAELPSLSIGILNSQETDGPKEAEVKLNFAIKTGLTQNIEQNLDDLAARIALTRQQQRRLLLSGLIREIVWSYKVAQIRFQFSEKKQAVLKKLEKNTQLLVSSGQQSEYGLLLFKQQSIDTQIALVERQLQMEQWLSRYERLTGLKMIPENIVEEPLNSAIISLPNHPEIQMTKLLFQQREQQIKLNSLQASKSWQLALTAKKTETAGIEDNQIGVSVEVPINVMALDSQANKNEWLQSKKQFDLDYEKTYLKLKGYLTNLVSNQRFLSGKLRLLEESANLSKQISKQLDLLKQNNEMGQELILNRLMKIIDSQEALALAEIYIQQNNVMIRQTAGVSL